MSLRDLLPVVSRGSAVKVLRDTLRDGRPAVSLMEGLHGSAMAVVMAAALTRVEERTVVCLLSDREEAENYFQDLTLMLGEERVALLPSSYRRAVKYGQRDAASEILRTDVVTRLASGVPLVVVTYPAALAEKVPAQEDVTALSITLKVGEAYDLMEVERRLLELGFHRRDYVYEPGEYAVRGSLLDVYSYTNDLPLRIDFFGDEVDSIRTFELQSQLSKDRRQEVTLMNAQQSCEEGPQLVPLTNYLPQSACLCVDDLALCIELVERTYEEGFSSAARTVDESLPDARRVLASGGEIAQGLLPLQRLQRKASPQYDAKDRVRHIAFDTAPQPLYHKNFDMLKEGFRALQSGGMQLYICADQPKQLERLREILDGVATFSGVGQTLHAGYTDRQADVCIFTDHEIFDRFHHAQLRTDEARNAKMALSLKELMQFEPGDYVVHVDHGIGRFMGLVREPGPDGKMRESIKLVYSNNAIVLVSIHALHKISKYKGQEGEPPSLSHLGTGAWERLKERTKKKLKDIARDLILLYARRRESQGFAFSPDGTMQQQLEASFAYEDTPDQQMVTQQVKEDMERRRPMDRLVCGDVGFGKTEVAVRAAFKAAADSKQVVVLVPTTVLALQHYRTFRDRLRDMPVRVDYLSRARSAKETREILADLEAGRIDIIVGTHKVIGKTVRFKDLGLLIIDEEQKFGVGVKERLRQLRADVDTLTLSATPIPRTLQFSLMGARDLSIIQTPPQGRYPIQTEVHTFSADVISEAINFEMSRSGQVFIVTHRISQLEHLRELIAKHVPDARVAIGHGQMAPEKLEKIILDFSDYNYDVLLSTTIVENGIDIPNANTIIIDNAHHFGLSDLHQMRGRVGRSNRKAFCYLLAPPLSALPDDSRRRLQAIENFSDLGSGIHIAMQDLDIRGAGNLLGAEQSGFIADLGYETYQKILSQAVSELRVEEFADLFGEEQEQTTQQALNIDGTLFVDDCQLDSDLPAYLPETYVPGSSERMLLYRELDGLQTDEQVKAYRVRMEDRFGRLPEEAEALLVVVRLRRLGRQLAAERLVLKNSRLVLNFVGQKDSSFYRSAVFERVIDFAMQHFRRCKIDEYKGQRRMVIDNVQSLQQAVELLQLIINA
ncbi:MAG: transcription-repair coupling factor [Bacteroidaceae bacterium]|nr:transcription-repair coupling factor [Bacteroidaceae bacterium]